MKSKIQYITRYGVWMLIGLFTFLLLMPRSAELNTLLLILLIEFTAIGLSGLAAYVYTRVDFTREYTRHELGLIFLGVHICAGLTMTGVYFTQFMV